MKNFYFTLTIMITFVCGLALSVYVMNQFGNGSTLSHKYSKSYDSLQVGKTYQFSTKLDRNNPYEKPLIDTVIIISKTNTENGTYVMYVPSNDTTSHRSGQEQFLTTLMKKIN
jgi:hypothetical protein